MALYLIGTQPDGLSQVSLPAIEIPRTNFRNLDCARRLDNRRDVKPAPKANRAKGPRLLAEAAPTK
jgi:hypothetical protein